MKSIRILELSNGRAPFEDWLSSLDPKVKIKILDYVKRLSLGGSKKNIKPLGGAIFELKINYRSGYRVYFAEVDRSIILILLGGNKSTQKNDIKTAKKYWRIHAN